MSSTTTTTLSFIRYSVTDVLESIVQFERTVRHSMHSQFPMITIHNTKTI